MTDDPGPVLEKPSAEDVSPFLVLHYDDFCNAACAHCVVESGPARRGRLDLAAARAAIAGAAADPSLRMVVFSGGETFIRLEEILALCREARGLGLKTRLISNGYWGRSPEKAAEYLERAAAGGCDELAISFDIYHVPYIKPERVSNIFLGAGLARDMPKLVFTAAIPPDPAAQALAALPDGRQWPRGVVDLLNLYGFDLSRCISVDEAGELLGPLPETLRGGLRRAMLRAYAVISWQVVVNGGRASSDMPDAFTSRIGVDAGGPCAVAGHQITMSSSGRLYPCCSAWTNFEQGAFGTVVDRESFELGLRAIRESRLVAAIRSHGPATILERLRERGDPLPESYSDICHMCQGLLSRRNLAELEEVAHPQAKQRT